MTVHFPTTRKARAEHLVLLDIQIGRRLRQRRKALGWSQEQLARKLGISYQQVQKYEKGTSSLTARRLHQLTHILRVPITFFVEGYRERTSSHKLASLPDDPNLALVRACKKIAAPRTKAAMKALIKAIAKT